ncbi:hypothetical protein GCM10007874_11190 [Labrys miyagiensis]|uniref:Helix-turn-helix domain-containing protein n=1 Tax=Labrys miyagiensis TaxID=346912 RepID=A0ABQ6CCU2_9HYPH|nr:hypothetical protein [Labrys miyagiensis]GLS18103.1 hypothetical protein GCM10007874_11190 [Labrys miyagiensis]
MNINPEQIAYSVPGAAKAIGSGETRVWEAIRRRELHAVRMGRRTLIPVAALRDYIAKLPPARPPEKS